MAYFATRTDRTLIAEGIETAEERDTLRTLGVVLGQGYLLGRPATLGRL
jgi:EAL domain-containing protein (putative c-di-GMP-specific phosphodiesterase class I)